MRNTLLGLAIVATLTIASCKQETKDKVGEATDAIGTEWIVVRHSLLKLMLQLIYQIKISTNEEGLQNESKKK
jgi:hypothetical protein